MNEGTLPTTDPAEAVRTCACGCGAEVANQYVKGHQFRKSAVDFTEDPETGCWIWQLALTGSGYGSIRVGSACRQAHLVIYEELVGPVPDGLVLDHLCRNRDCVNPGHVEPVTERENLLRGDGWGAKNARKTHCPRGHLLSGDNLKVTSAGARRCRTCERHSRVRCRSRKKLEIARRRMLRVLTLLDRNGRYGDAVHCLRLSLTALDDTIDHLESPDSTCTCSEFARQEGIPEFDCPVHGVASEQPTSSLRLDRLMDLQADADRSVER